MGDEVPPPVLLLTLHIEAVECGLLVLRWAAETVRTTRHNNSSSLRLQLMMLSTLLAVVGFLNTTRQGLDARGGGSRSSAHFSEPVGHLCLALARKTWAVRDVEVWMFNFSDAFQRSG